jgi:hypothetical protein
LTNNDKGITYRHIDGWEGFVEYAIETGSGAIIHIPSFMKIGAGIQKLMTHRKQSDLTIMLLFFQNKESRLEGNRHSTVYPQSPFVVLNNCGAQTN